jgi:hypothetical protein
MEHTLLSVFIAEACCRRLLPIDKIPSSRDLRLRYLKELLAPYERNAALEQCGIPTNLTPSHVVDTRANLSWPKTQILVNEDFLPQLENFDMSALRTAFSAKPAEISRVRYLRIVQYVNEIGSPAILDTLKSALAKQPETRIATTVKDSTYEKLFHIHIYLDTQRSHDHLSLARSRYVKYCYFETYQVAVKALSDEKHNSHREQHVAIVRKSRGASLKQGFCEDVLDTPHTDNIDRSYNILTNEEKKKRAPDMVKCEIARRVANQTTPGVDENRIRKDVTKYIKEGRVLHYLLQDKICLSPGFLILFPGQGMHQPSLAPRDFRCNLEAKEQSSLSKAFKIKE